MFIYVESECRGYTPGSCGALLASLVFVRDELKGREMEMCRQASERVAQHGGSAPDPGKSHGHVMTLKGVWPGRAGPTLILATGVSLFFFFFFFLYCLTDWQLNRGLNEGSVVPAREAF